MTSGYSGTPQARKLGLKTGLRVAIEHASPGWALVDPPPFEPVSADEPADIVLAFVRAEAELGPCVAAAKDRIFPNGALWLAWPRRAGGHTSDITDNAIRDVVLPLGLVDVKVAAIDEDWSGLKIVWRKENR